MCVNRIVDAGNWLLITGYWFLASSQKREASSRWKVTVISYWLLELRWVLLADRGVIKQASFLLLRPMILNFW